MEALLKDLKRIIDIPSVKGEAEDKTPFGAPIKKVLEETLSIFESYGFKTFMEPEGYYGYAEMGEGELFGVLGHLDVVGTGSLSDWNHDPFDMIEKDGYILGRGIQDDKGPVITVLHALKSLLD